MTGMATSHLSADTFSGVRMRGDVDDPGMRDRILRLYDEVRPSLLAYLLGLGLPALEAEDIIQEAVVRLTHHLLERRSETNLRGWLFKVAHNLYADERRSARRFAGEDPLIVLD